jgi:hypothetical protein
MRSFVKATIVASAVGVFLLLGSPGEAQEVTTIQQSPELKVLQRFIGSWEFHVVFNPAEWTPERKTTTLAVEVEWTLRGRMIEQRCVWAPDNTHGLGLMTYDAETEEYRSWYFDSNGVIPREETRGQWDEATETFKWKATSVNGTVTQSHRFIDKDTFQWTFVFKDSDGKVVLDTEAKARRK